MNEFFFFSKKIRIELFNLTWVLFKQFYKNYIMFTKDILELLSQYRDTVVFFLKDILPSKSDTGPCLVGWFNQ